MEWLPFIINLLVGTLIPSVVLWLVGKKVQYDFAFWKLLVITGAAALTKQIPYGGMWISLPVYYGLFCLLTGINFIEAMWMSFLAFLVYAAVGFVIMMYLGSLFAASLESDRVTEPVPEPAVAALSPSAPEAGEPPAPAPQAREPAGTPKWLSAKYTVNGIAQRGGTMIAIVNDDVVSAGDSLGENLRVYRIESNFIILQMEDELYTLNYEAVQATGDRD